MRVQVEIECSAVPPPEEMEKVRRAGMMLAPDWNTVSVRRGETSRGKPSIILDFGMKTEPQYKVVDDISRTIQSWVGGEFYSDIVIRFLQKPSSDRGG